MHARTVDGVTLRLDHVRARGVRRGVVVCLHAMMTDGRYFGARRDDSFAAALADAGHDVVVADFRGHGDSRGPADWSFDDLVEFDLPAIVAAVDCDPRELALVGHSLGGLVATAALATARIPAPRLVVLAATAVWLSGRRRRALMSVYRGAARLFGKAPIRALRLGSVDEPVGYVEQLAGWAHAGRWTSRGGLDYGAALATITTPVLPFVGAGDWMCTREDATAFAARIPTAAPVRVVGTQHGDALDPDHFQLFTRPALRPLWNDLIDRL